MQKLTAASYNIRHCFGLDGECRPDRIAEVINEINADIIGLQEVDSGVRYPGGLCQTDFLSKTTGLNAIASPTIRNSDGHYGNVILTRGEILNVRHHDLSFHKREPRGAIDIDLLINGQNIRVISAHLGLKAWERHAQVSRLLKMIEHEKRFMVLLGDFNEWRPMNRSVRKLNSRFGKSPALRTFPANMPLLKLDRIWVQPSDALISVERHVTEHSRIASDHLPIVASLTVPDFLVAQSA
jgi:endonuclease/exonuclease/phosphatase family metal-dependent hydrolase